MTEVTNKLSLNFGMRYEPQFPFYSANKAHPVPARPAIECFPAAPAGLVYDDANVPRGGTGNDINNLAPRFDSPETLGTGKTSIRGAYGFSLTCRASTS